MPNILSTDKIFEDLDKNKIIDRLLEGMGKFPIDTDNISVSRIAEIHMVAVLLNQEKTNSFVQKEQRQRKYYQIYGNMGVSN